MSYRGRVFRIGDIVVVPHTPTTNAWYCTVIYTAKDKENLKKNKIVHTDLLTEEQEINLFTLVKMITQAAACEDSREKQELLMEIIKMLNIDLGIKSK